MVSCNLRVLGDTLAAGCVGSGHQGAFMGLRFEWDPKKAAANLEKHKVAFEEAATAFADPLSITTPDPDHSIRESRFILIGQTFAGQTVVIAHMERRDQIRIISARRATRREANAYEESE